MDFILITNDPARALAAETSGIDRVMVDLEIEGKVARQGHLNTVISRHSIEDVERLRPVLKAAMLMVRVNPWGSSSSMEIERSIAAGAACVMLPMFRTDAEVSAFVDTVAGRAKVSLLLETRAAWERVEAILDVPGVDEVHVGLNDLHLEYGLAFMFELLPNGCVARVAAAAHARGIKFGFGGVARLGHGLLSPELVLSEHLRLGSTQVILSRDFHAVLVGLEDGGRLARREVDALRACITRLQGRTPLEFAAAEAEFGLAVKRVVAERRTRR